MFGPIKKKARRRMAKALGRAKPAAAAALAKVKKVKPAVASTVSAAPSALPKGIQKRVAAGKGLPKGKPFNSGTGFNPPGLMKKKKKGL